MPEPPKSDPHVLPRRFPAWYGLAVAGVIVGGLSLAGWLGWMPPALWTVAGRLMLAAHALAIFAFVGLLGELLRLHAWAGALRRQDRLTPEAITSGPIWDGINMALTVLRRRHARVELQGAIAATRDVLEREYARRWKLARDLCFLIPLFGCLLSLWNLRLESNVVPFREVGLPLIIAVVEMMPVLLLATWLGRDVAVTLDQWKLAAEAVAGIRRPEGLMTDPDLEEMAEDHDEATLDTTPPAPPPVRKPVPPPQPTPPTQPIPIPAPDRPRAEPKQTPVSTKDTPSEPVRAEPKKPRKPVDPVDDYL
jgi:hypothetical protein